jgi:type IV pilus assembly protein PilY1
MVYAGANDGMLHAFNGALSGTGAGAEQFAYIPSALFQGPNGTPQVDGLAEIGNPSYVHHYYVDATPLAFDVDFNYAGGTFSTVSAGTSDWHTLLIGGLGKGGKSFYAIDVTDPASMSTESAAAGKVLWEFTDSTMGYSFGAPVVAKTAKYGWVVALTSGYNNSDGYGYLYLVNPKTGALLEKIATPSASAGLAQATSYIQDYTNYTADSIYVGDLNGQIWRFDLTLPKGSTTAYPAPTLLATLTDASGNAQPVTTAPLIEIHPTTRKRFVLVGTGQLLSSADITSSAAQSFYAIIDGTSTMFNSISTPIARSDLQAVVDVTAGITLSINSKGWYTDLGISSSIGWRVVVNPVAYNGIVAFTDLLTTGDACSPSGSSRVYVLNYATGTSVLNPATTGSTTPAPYMSFTTAVTDLKIVGINSGSGISPEIIVGTNAGGPPTKVPANLTGVIATRLLNWREIPTAD